MTNTQAKPTLVLGATGKTGRRVIEQLTAAGVPVRVGSRTANPPFDWNEPTTWAPALEGVGSVYISYYPDLAAPGAVEATGALAELAVEKGPGDWCSWPGAVRLRPSAPSKPCGSPAPT